MRIFHHWEKWECVKAGMYETLPPAPLTSEECLQKYAEFLRDSPRFEAALGRVVLEWPISCEQFLSNTNINRIAWLGQASMCIETGIPAVFRGGFKLLSYAEQELADAVANVCLTTWELNFAETDRRILDEVEAAGLS